MRYSPTGIVLWFFAGMIKKNTMTKLETIIQLAKIGFGIYFVWWSYHVLAILRFIVLELAYVR